jgi:hypothetical protein
MGSLSFELNCGQSGTSELKEPLHHTQWIIGCKFCIPPPAVAAGKSIPENKKPRQNRGWV